MKFLNARLIHGHHVPRMHGRYRSFGKSPTRTATSATKFERVLKRICTEVQRMLLQLRALALFRADRMKRRQFINCETVGSLRLFFFADKLYSDIPRTSRQSNIPRKIGHFGCGIVAGSADLP